MSSFYSYFIDVAYSFTNCLSCFPSSPNLKINGRSYRILRLLGEGGFSYVYLVQPPSEPTIFHALKKIRCPFGAESVALALREVEAYSLFTPHPNIIHAIDHAVVTDKSGSRALSGIGTSDPSAGGGGHGEAKTVYILLPYYSRGNLQDAINANLVNRTRMGERRLMVLMLGVCRALDAMHNYKAGGTMSRGKKGVKDAKRVRGEAARADAEMRGEQPSRGRGDDDDPAAAAAAAAGDDTRANSSRPRRLNPSSSSSTTTAGADQQPPDEDDTEQEPLMVSSSLTSHQNNTTPGTPTAYAHRDIKPSNIMIAPNGHTPILMDLGSLTPSPTPITSRSAALAVQDTAAEHSTMPYRAPELFDVRVGGTVDTSVDIWSLGCTVYACLVGKSPFERRSEETGGSLTMCVLGGDWRWPDEGSAGRGKHDGERDRGGGGQSAGGSGGGSNKGGGRAAGESSSGELVVSEAVKEVVAACLRVEPAERPDVRKLMGMVEDCIARLPRDEGDVDGDDDDGGSGDESELD